MSHRLPAGARLHLQYMAREGDQGRPMARMSEAVTSPHRNRSTNSVSCAAPSSSAVANGACRATQCTVQGHG